MNQSGERIRSINQKKKKFPPKQIETYFQIFFFVNESKLHTEMDLDQTNYLALIHVSKISTIPNGDTQNYWINYMFISEQYQTFNLIIILLNIDHTILEQPRMPYN